MLRARRQQPNPESLPPIAPHQPVASQKNPSQETPAPAHKKPRTSRAGDACLRPSADAITLDNYGDAIIAVRNSAYPEEDIGHAANALLEVYHKNGDTRILYCFAELYAKNPRFLDMVVKSLSRDIAVSRSDKFLCDICDMLIKFETLPAGLEDELYARFSSHAVGDPTFSQIKEAAVLLKFNNARDGIREWLEECCRHKKKHIRLASVAAIGRLGKTAGAKSLLKIKELLSDPSVAVRVMSADAIWTISDNSDNSEAIMPILESALRDPPEAIVLRPVGISEWVMDHRHVAASCLRRIGMASRDAIRALIALLHDDDSVLRVTVIRALGEVGKGNEEVKRSIEALARDPDAAVRLEVTIALKSLSK